MKQILIAILLFLISANKSFAIDTKYFVSDEPGTQYKYQGIYFYSETPNKNFEKDFNFCTNSAVEYIDDESEGYKVSKSFGESDQSIALKLTKDCMMVKDWGLKQKIEGKLVKLIYFQGKSRPETRMTEEEITQARKDLIELKEWYKKYHPEVFTNESRKKITKNNILLSASNCIISGFENLTPEKFIENYKRNTPMSKSTDKENKCLPNTKTIIAIGKPICYFDKSIPTIGVAATSITKNGNTELVMYSMRGREDDVQRITSYLDTRFEPADEEYFSNIDNRITFNSSMVIWKNKSHYILLGQNESGYDPEERSLHLVVGTVNGFELEHSNENICTR